MDTLYKFASSEPAVIAMIGGSLKFTRISELNDPSELVSFMDREAVRDSLYTIRKRGFSPEQFRWLAHQEAILRLLSPETRILDCPSTLEEANRTLALPIYDNFDYIEDQLTASIALMRTRFGVLSLTERYNSLPMWAHYGVQANGFVVRFNGLHHHFANDKTGSFNILKPVKYVEDMIGLTHDPITQDNLFFSKFQDWSYEREWRIVRALSQCDFSEDGNMYLHQIPPEIVNGVIVGWNVRSEAIDSLAHKLSEVRSDIEIVRAVLENGRVALKPLQQ